MIAAMKPYPNFAVRTLQLTALKPPGLIRIDDMARVHGLARPHIVKIVPELGLAGYVVTQRGRSGVFLLATPVDAVVVGDVIRLREALSRL